MADQQEIPGLLASIIQNGRLDPTDPESVKQRAALYARDGQDLVLNWDGWRTLRRIIRALHADPAIAESLSLDEVAEEVIETLIDAGTALDEPSFDVEALATRLLRDLHAGQEDWHFLALVPGLEMAPAQTLSIAGLTIGPLTDEERAGYLSQAERIGSRAYFADNPQPGSARDYLVRERREYLEGNDCWARGTIRCQETALDGIVKERLNIVALNVLRCFALAIQQNPDRIHLGQPHFAFVNKVMHFKVEPDGTIDRYVEGHSRYGDRLPLALSTQDIQDLEQWQPFMLAREIVDRWIEDAASVGELENKILLAILQFGSASSLDPLEVRLQNYLTVLETLYGRELVDNNDDFRKAARRLSLWLNAEARQRFREEVRRLYAVRRHPIHYGARNLRGREIVTGEDVQSARHIAFQAIMYALQRAPEFQGEGSHEAFIDALDAELSPMPVEKRKYLFVAWRDRIAQRFHALAPDFPGIQGEGVTADRAYRDARAQVEAEIRRLSESHQVIPESTAVYREPQLAVPSDAAAVGGEDGSSELGG